MTALRTNYQPRRRGVRFFRKQRSNVFIDACDSSITIKLGRLLFHVKSVDCRVNSLLRTETPEWLKDSFTWGVREDKSNSIDRRSIVVNHRNCHSHLRHYHRTLSASNGPDRLVDFEHGILPNSIFGHEFNQARKGARQDSRHYASYSVLASAIIGIFNIQWHLAWMKFENKHTQLDPLIVSSEVVYFLISIIFYWKLDKECVQLLLCISVWGCIYYFLNLEVHIKNEFAEELLKHPRWLFM